jgi:hypothetical protein
MLILARGRIRSTDIQPTFHNLRSTAGYGLLNPQVAQQPVERLLVGVILCSPRGGPLLFAAPAPVRSASA